MKPKILVQKRLFRIIYLSVILLLLFTPITQAQRIIGYFPNYNYSAANAAGIQYAKLTHLYYFSLNPTRSVVGQSTGSLWFNDPYSWFTTASFNDVNAKARAANPTIKIFIVTGGSPGSDSDLSTRLQYIGSNAGPLNTFCNNIINFMVANNLDGWDLDWEFPDNAAARTAHQNLLAKMRFKIDSLKTASCKYYEITAAVGGGYTDRLVHTCWTPAHTDYITQTAINYLDQINLMTYDGNIGSPPCSFSSHQHYDLVTKAFTDWTTDFTIPASKINIGVGFYDNSGTDFNSIGNVSTRYNNATYWNGGSGCPNMQAKIDYIHAQGGSGTMIWELTQDNLCAGTTPACYSLLDCIYQYTHSSWGTWVSPTVSCTAPVDLVSFVGTAGELGNELSWSTAMEINNDRFEIEKSTDGDTYAMIGTVNGVGNSNTLLNYHFTDVFNATEKSYYRLHQFDKDGKYTYSKTVVVYSLAKRELNIQSSPNPFKDQCMITVTGIEGEASAQLIIYDLIGNVYNQEITEVTNGSYEIGKNLTSGIYICALKFQDKTKHLRIIKMK
jgi:GH18 family chitinase